jgi:hypothetical protein
MRVTIWDMDFYYKATVVPNPEVMKISSFHKQNGDLINFVEEKGHINMPYDLFYLVKDKRRTKMPPGKLMDDDRVRLMGRYFKHFPNYWLLTDVVAAVRPDYLLYPEKKYGAYYNANFVKFYNKGRKLEVIQPFENTKKYHKKTVVIDKDFWIHGEKDIISCLETLTTYKNISFLAPIKLKIIINSPRIRKLFLKINFSQGTIFKFQNNIGSTFEKAAVMFDFIEDLKEINPSVRFGDIPIRCVSTDHWEDKENAINDLERCLQIMNEAKERKIHIILVSPKRRDFETPYWYYFEILEVWSKQFYDKSYIELMLNSSMRRFKLPWYAILNDSMKWSLPNLTYLLRILVNKPEWIEKYGYRKWGEKMLNKQLINWEEIEKFRGGETIE